MRDTPLAVGLCATASGLGCWVTPEPEDVFLTSGQFERRILDIYAPLHLLLLAQHLGVKRLTHRLLAGSEGAKVMARQPFPAPGASPTSCQVCPPSRLWNSSPSELRAASRCCGSLGSIATAFHSST